MTKEFLPVCRPLLPPVADIAHWLSQADTARHYTNRGQLVQRLEAALCERLSLPAHGLRTASNGTSAIEVAILAHAGPARKDRPLALIPSYTFAATALAAERTGYQVALSDVDPSTWALDLVAALHHPDLDRIGLVVQVAPFGRAPDLAAAEAFQARTGIPVVIDAAASFERFDDRPGLLSAALPVTLSFHATKTFSTAEGGAVIWDNAEGQDRVVRAANFGFNWSRKSESAGTNAKLSEYHAAVGLAMLDGFDQRRSDYARAARDWAEAAARLPGRVWMPPDLASVYILWETASAALLDRAQDALTEANIDSRRWYEAGLHSQPHFRRETLPPVLPVTERLGTRLLGLPMAHDMARADMERVVETLLQALPQT